MKDLIVPLYKHSGETSHDCVDHIRRLFGVKKAGHTGTLDPDVEGVLPICTGNATKVADYMADFPKQYEAEITLGCATATEDAGGEIIEKQPVYEPVPEKMIQEITARFQGRQKQVPPMYSAVKVGGRKLYEYAREGKTVERPPKEIEIFHIRMIPGTLYHDGVETASFRITVTCSKGTFIRTLAVDIGKALGFAAHMSKLIRTSSGPFSVQDCYTLEQLKLKKQEETLESTGFPIEKALKHLPCIEVQDETAEKIRNGSVLKKEYGRDVSPFVFMNKGRALAVYQHHPDKPGLIKPKTMLGRF